jgi:uncharacterized protein (DUF1330 family)
MHARGRAQQLLLHPTLNPHPRYAKLSGPALAPFGARYLALGDAAAAYEHGLKERIVIVEFPSLDKAIAARESAAYRDALKALGDGAVRDFRIVEGRE